MVEREGDAVVAVVGEQGERVVEPVVAEPVRDVGRAEGSRRPPAAAAEHAGQAAGDRPRRRRLPFPEATSSAACSGSRPRTPVPTRAGRSQRSARGPPRARRRAEAGRVCTEEAAPAATAGAAAPRPAAKPPQRRRRRRWRPALPPPAAGCLLAPRSRLTQGDGTACGRRRRRPPAGRARAVARSPHEDVHEAGRGHRRRARQALLQHEVVGPHRARERRGRGGARPPAGKLRLPRCPAPVSEAARPRAKPCRDPPGGERAGAGRSTRVDLPVGVVVQRHAGPGTAGRTEEPIPSAAPRPSGQPGRGRSEEDVTRHREDRGKPDELRDVTQRRARPPHAGAFTSPSPAAQSHEQLRTAASSRCSSVPTGSLKKKASSLHRPAQPGRVRPARRAGRDRARAARPEPSRSPPR